MDLWEEYIESLGRSYAYEQYQYQERQKLEKDIFK